MAMYVATQIATFNGNVLHLDSLSTEAAVIITFGITFILTLIITAVITFIVTYICVKRKFEKILQDMKDKQKNKTEIYKQVVQPTNTVTKGALELQPNPAYGTSHKVTMDINPAYESCKQLTDLFTKSTQLQLQLLTHVQLHIICYPYCAVLITAIHPLVQIIANSQLFCFANVHVCI